MTSRDFCYWLQGYFEINGISRNGISPEQAEMIRKHLELVFVHEIDKSFGDAEHQAILNGIHSSQTGVMPPKQPYKVQLGGFDPLSKMTIRC